MKNFWNQSLTLSTFFLGLAGFFCVTLGAGFLLFKTLSVPYEFQPDYIVIKQDQPVHRITNEQDVQYFENLKNKIYIENEELLEIGNFIEKNQYGLLVHDKSNQTYTFKPSSQSITTIPNLKFTMINDYVEIMAPEFADRIDTEEELQKLLSVLDQFYPSEEELTIGKFIVQGREGHHLYHLLDDHLYSFEKITDPL